jgi:hypothetical membrane protein
MRQVDRFCLICGLIAGVVFIAFPAVLGALLPGYDPFAQTVSEIGQEGSPFETVYKMFFFIVVGCLCLFSYGVYRFAFRRQLSRLPALLLGFFAAMELGVAIFEAPHPLHNVFGISSMLGFLAPMALAMTWPRRLDGSDIGLVSQIAAVLVAIAIGLNLMPVFVAERDAPVWLREYYGLVQRMLMLVFYGWCIYLALKLFRSEARLA